MPVIRQVMATAKYCSTQCRQANAMDAYKKRIKKALGTKKPPR